MVISWSASRLATLVAGALVGGCTGGQDPESASTPPPRPAHLEEWRDPFTGMEFVFLSGGCYEMGLPAHGTQPRRGADLLHEVCVSGVWVGRTEVTRGQFERFVQETGYRTQAEAEGFSWFWSGREWEEGYGMDWRNPGFPQAADHPVVHVSWHDARRMAAWLSTKGQGRFRLLTEAEWEYTCRAGGGSFPPWGDDPAAACLFANIADHSAGRAFPGRPTEACDDGFANTAPVGSFPGNAFGARDLLGNVWEWTQDRFSESAYQHHGREDPVYLGGGWLSRLRLLFLEDGNPASYRVLRGASWIYDVSDAHMHCSARRGLRPDYRSWGLGFRLAREPAL